MLQLLAMYSSSSKILRSCVRSCRAVPCRAQHSDHPNYRAVTQHNNNPYKDQFLNRKPRTFRERYIESIRNTPKPKIGVGDSDYDFLHIKRKVKGRAV